MKSKILTCFMFAFSALSSMAQDFGGLLDVGTVAPDLVNEKGNVLSLENNRGRCVVLYFWASWCPNIEEYTPKMKELFATYDMKGVEFIGVSYDTDKETLDKYLKKESIQWKTICELKEWKETNTAKDYRLNKIPTMYLIDTEGKVVLATENIGKLKGMLKKMQNNRQLVAPSLEGEDQLPQFVGGIPVLMKFLGANLRYPSIAERFRMEGKVVVDFVIEKDGKVNVTGAKVTELNDVFHLPKYERLSDERKNQIIEEGKRQMINEARRVACLMPDWIPAKRRGKEVRVSHTLPITFKLQ